MTSRAVVGSSAMTIGRIARQRHGDHRPLAHAAGQLVRVGGRALAGDADQLEQRRRALEGVLGSREPDLDRLGDLLADPADRVERVHRALEDDADLAPAIPPQLLLGLGHEVDAEQLDLVPLRSAAFAGRSRTSESSGRRLAAAGLAGDPERLAVAQREAHPVDRLDPAVARA